MYQIYATLRDRDGLKDSDVAKATGITKSTFSDWKSGRSAPKEDKLRKIADFFSVTTDFIKYGINMDNEKSMSNRIKVYGSVPAGIPLEAIEDVVDWEDIPKEWLIGGQEYIGLKVKGDSMYPKYLDGDTVIVRLQPDCECGQEAVVYTNGYDATLKKVVKQQDGIMLQPLNPEYVPSVYPYGDDNQVKILGVVVEIRRKV